VFILNPTPFHDVTEKTEDLRKQLKINWDYSKLPDAVLPNTVTELHKAVSAGNLEQVKSLIAKGVDHRVPVSVYY